MTIHPSGLFMIFVPSGWRLAARRSATAGQMTRDVR